MFPGLTQKGETMKKPYMVEYSTDNSEVYQTAAMVSRILIGVMVFLAVNSYFF